MNRISDLQAAVLRWKCRAYSFGAMPFIAVIGADVVSRGAVLPAWGIGVMALAAGALGERKPDIVQLDPSWHHNYASLGWFSGAGVP